MQMTLRQAHKMVEKINARMASINVSPSRDVVVWNANSGSLDTLRAEFENEVNRQIHLTNVRQTLRVGIQRANRDQVDDLITARKATLDQIGILRHVVGQVNTDHMYTAEAIENKAAALRTAASAGSSGYGQRDTVTVCVVTADQLAHYNAQIDLLQLQLEQIEDELTAANASKSSVVVLDDVAVEILRAEKLVA